MNELFRKFSQTINVQAFSDEDLEELHKQSQRLHQLEEKHLKAELAAIDD